MSRTSTKNLVLAAILTAIVIVLQMLGAAIKLGPFSISLVLVPIVIGAATCGIGIGAWLGFVFGAAVLLSGDAALFLAVNVPGTILTVMAKGTLCGLAAGAVYKSVCRFGKYAAVVLAAIVCPIVNTGVFLAGCLAFFMETIETWAGGTSVAQYMIVGLVGLNFLAEMAINIVLSPIVVRLINIRK